MIGRSSRLGQISLHLAIGAGADGARSQPVKLRLGRETPRTTEVGFRKFFSSFSGANGSGVVGSSVSDSRATPSPCGRFLAAKSLRIRVGLKVGTADLPWSRNNAQVSGSDA